MELYDPAKGLVALGRLSFISSFWYRVGIVVAVISATSIGLVQSDETKLERADQNREAAQARAQSQLGYSYVFRDARDRHIDYVSLAAQVSELSRVIAAMAAQQSPTALTPPNVPITRGMSRAQSSNLTRLSYGPDGPTVKSVTLIAEYQLLKNGNKRLKLGDVLDRGDDLTVEIVTLEGSLVEKHRILKDTGEWMPVDGP
jgi:hypothetical protein